MGLLEREGWDWRGQRVREKALEMMGAIEKLNLAIEASKANEKLIKVSLRPWKDSIVWKHIMLVLRF